MTKQELNTLIINNIKTNDAGLITGLILQQILLYMSDYSVNAQELSTSFISKLVDDVTYGLITHLKGARYGDFTPGHNGTGGKIDEFGRAELESLIIRSILEVPELRFNRLTVVGDEIAVSTGGMVEQVIELLDPNQFILKLKLEENEPVIFQEDDIIKGIFRQITGSDLVGIRTSWFRVIDVDQSNQTMHIVLGNDAAVPGGLNFPPQPSMNIARTGNFTDETRQTYMYLSATEGCIIMLDGVDNYGAGTKSFQLGKPGSLEGIIDFDKLTQIDKNASYLYARGIMVQNIIKVDVLGAPIREIRDRGVWSLEVATSDSPYKITEVIQDEVWIGWSRFRCIVDETVEEPSKEATDWVLVYSIEDAIEHETRDLVEGLDDIAGQINAAESNLGELTGAFNTLRDETLVAMEDGLIAEAERRSLYAIYVRLDIEQEQLFSDVMYAINSIYMPPIYKAKLQSISDKFLSAGGSLDQYQASIDAILDHTGPYITDYEREEYNRTLLIYSRDHTKLVNALRDSRLAIDAEIKRLANEKAEELEGGKNLIRNYDQRWDWDFWGGDGISVDIDIDAITIVNQRGLIDDGNLIEDESGNIIELV